MTRSNLIRAAWLRCALSALLLALSACGGGVETGGTGAGAYVQGPISGFGSVIVAGVRFDDSCNNCVRDADDRPFTREQLRLGMVVEVESGPIRDDGSGGRAATATRVRLGSALLGPISASADAGTRLAVLGQAVRLTATTVMDGVVGGAAALAIGDIVEVHGFIDAQTGGYLATRVERRSAAPPRYQLRGLVTEVNRDAMTLRIGTQVFDLTSIGGVPAGLTGGQIVRLSLDTTALGGRWLVLGLATDLRRPDDRDEVELEGLITSFDSFRSFSVNGMAVDAATAGFPDGSTGLGLGVRVEVSGRTRAGVLVAASVKIESEDEAFSKGFDLRGQIDNFNPQASTFTLREITVFYGTVPPPRFENGSADGLQRGRSVRVRATLGPDRTRVIATRIEFVSN